MKFIPFLMSLFSVTPAWSQIEELKDLNIKDAVIVDVRTPGEYGVEHLPEAQNIDIYSSQFQKEILKIKKNKTVLVYCRSGNRSGQALRFLKDQGYTKAFNLGSLGSALDFYKSKSK